MSERDVISMQGVDFAYEADAPVLSGVNLRIAEGDFACIVGPNGGGKTTLLRLLLGLLEPSVGTVRVFGASPKQSRARIGYMPQHARLDWQFPVSVMDVVLMGRLGRAGLGPYRKEDREQAGRALAEVGLGSRKKDAFSSLSGGQRQRVLIARALACEPELLLLDEPTSNMDIAAQSDFFRLLDDMNRRLTLVLVSHDVAFVSKFVRTVVCVNRSVVVHATGEITDENLRDLYGREMRAVVHAHGYGEEAGGEPGHLHGPSCDHDHGPTTGGAAHSNAKVKP